MKLIQLKITVSTKSEVTMSEQQISTALEAIEHVDLQSVFSNIVEESGFGEMLKVKVEEC